MCVSMHSKEKLIWDKDKFVMVLVYSNVLLFKIVVYLVHKYNYCLQSNDTIINSTKYKYTFTDSQYLYLGQVENKWNPTIMYYMVTIDHTVMHTTLF